MDIDALTAALLGETPKEPTPEKEPEMEKVSSEEVAAVAAELKEAANEEHMRKTASNRAALKLLALADVLGNA